MLDSADLENENNKSDAMTEKPQATEVSENVGVVSQKPHEQEVSSSTQNGTEPAVVNEGHQSVEVGEKEDETTQSEPKSASTRDIKEPSIGVTSKSPSVRNSTVPHTPEVDHTTPQPKNKSVRKAGTGKRRSRKSRRKHRLQRKLRQLRKLRKKLRKTLQSVNEFLGAHARRDGSNSDEDTSDESGPNEGTSPNDSSSAEASSDDVSGSGGDNGEHSSSGFWTSKFSLFTTANAAKLYL